MKTILVIDEDHAMRENTAEILELSNYHVLAEENLKRGLETARDKRPDMIIFDDITHKTNDPDLLRKLRLTAGIDHIPLILLTDSVERKDKNRRPENGPDEYLSKPFEVEELLNLVANCLMQPANNKDGRVEDQA